MHPFANYLDTRLQHALPGMEAQRRMAPRFENGSVRSFDAPPNSKHSAVLALLTMVNDEISVVLTLRSNNLPSHKGQISFPGGRMDDGETYEQTALRETFEEIGIPEHTITILGRLSDLYTPPSNSSIHPVVGWCSELPQLTLSQSEVDECFTVPLHMLHSAEHVTEEEWEYRNQRMTVPFWKVHPTTPLWGATAVMLSELMELYSQWLATQ
ncbi:MAG: CoA pyrophosphatase [Candidatus Kapabacteria bacterium]|nr:CoA pyrophosphatase [Candidatus Kapabacteria bacterium]